MSNTFTNTFRQNFASTVEGLLKEYAVYTVLRGTEAENVLRANKGDVYKFITLTEGLAQEGSTYTDLTIDGSTLSPDTLTLDTRSAYTFKLNDEDSAVHQAAGSFLSRQMENAKKVLIRDLEGSFFGQYSQATSDFDDGDIGGTPGTKLTWSAANVDNIYTEAAAIIASQTGSAGGYAAVITPQQAAKIAQAGFANGNAVSDRMWGTGVKPGDNGFVGNFFGVDTFVSHNLNHEVSYTYSDVGTADATFTIATQAGTVTFTNKATPTAANDVDIHASTEEGQAANLAAAINQGTGAGSVYIAASDADARKLRGISATVDGATVTIVSKYGKMTITENDANLAVSQAQFAHNYFGEYGAIELAHPQGVRSVVREEPRQTTTNYISEVFYGVAVPTNNKEKFLDVQVLV